MFLNFAIKVHALKSSARLIGAINLSKAAKHLEELGNSLTQEDIKRIEELTPELLASYRKFLDVFSPLYAEEEAARNSAQEISPDELNEAYETIKQFIESFDIDAIDGFISEIRKYRIPKSEAAKFAIKLRSASATLTGAALKTPCGCRIKYIIIKQAVAFALTLNVRLKQS